MFARGHAADIILAVMGAEALWLVARSHWPVARALCRLAPGALIVIALRGAMTGAAWPWIAAPLMLSFPPHIADLRGWRGD